MARSFLQWLRGDRPDEWKQQKRLPPRGATPEMSFVFSQEFTNPGRFNRRVFACALRRTDHEYDLYTCAADLKKTPDDAPAKFVQRGASVEEAVLFLREFEETSRKSGLVPVELPGSESNYYAFANEHGLHLDAKGEIFEVSKDIPVARDAFMTRKGLDAVFASAAKEKIIEESSPVIHDWQSLYDNLVNKPPVEGVSGEDLSKEWLWPNFSYNSRQMLRALKEILPRMKDPNRRAVSAADAAELGAALKIGMESVAFISTNAKRQYAAHVLKSTILVGMLRTGSELYQEQFGKALALDPQKLAIIRDFSQSCADIAKKVFGMSDAEAKAVSEIITQGPDPNGPELPIEKLLNQYPAPDDWRTLTMRHVERPYRDDYPFG